MLHIWEQCRKTLECTQQVLFGVSRNYQPPNLWFVTIIIVVMWYHSINILSPYEHPIILGQPWMGSVILSAFAINIVCKWLYTKIRILSNQLAISFFAGYQRLTVNIIILSSYYSLPMMMIG